MRAAMSGGTVLGPPAGAGVAGAAGAGAAGAAAGAGACWLANKSTWQSDDSLMIQTEGLCLSGLNPMYATCLPATSSPTRRSLGAVSPGPCIAASDQVGSGDSVMI